MSVTAITACLIAISWLTLQLIKIFVEFRNKKLDHLPGPPSSNIWLGNYSELQDATTRMKKITEWHEQYGSIFRLKGGLFTASEVVIVNPEKEPQLMQIPDKGSGFWPFKWFLKTLTKHEPTFILDGPLWKQRRMEVVHSGFMFKHLEENNEIFVKNLRKICQMLEDTKGKPTDIHILGSIFMIDSMSEFLFEESLGTIENQQHPFIKVFEQILKTMATVQNYPPHFFRPSVMFHLWKLGKTLTEYPARQVALRLQNPEKYENSNDVCSRVMRTGKLDPELVAFELNAALLASSGNPSLSVMWMLYAVVTHPEVMKKLLEEIDEVLGDKRFPDYEDLKQMKYADCIIQESFRMFIPDAIHRRMPSDTEVEGYKLPEGTQIWIPSFLSHYEGIENARSFIPERFMDAKFNNGAQVKIHPFGGGPRICVGHLWTKLAVKVFLCTIFRNFQVSLDPANPPVKSEFHMLLFESTRIKFLFLPRDN